VRFCGLRAVIRKEILQMARDYRTLGFLLGLPALLLVMFGFALNFDVKHIPLAVCDEDRTAASRDLAGSFSRTEYFDIVARPSDRREIDLLMGEEKIRAAVVIPRDFSRNLLAGREAPVQVIVDGANSMSASTAAGYIGTIAQNYSVRATIRLLSERGMKDFRMPLEAAVRVWYNPELRSANFLVPGLMAFILMVIVVISTAFSVVREKERGTMEQIAVSPIQPFELIAGKTVPYVLLSLASSHSVLLLGSVLFGVSVRGNYFLLLLTMTLFLVGGLGQGLFISTITRTQQVAFQLAVLSTFLPTFILSGFIFPVRNMPPVIQAITTLIPARFFLGALRGIVLKGAGFHAIWKDLLYLAGFAVLTLGVSTLRMRASVADGGDGRRGRRRRPR
jgi:ABC-2 type transport system permease protein